MNNKNPKVVLYIPTFARDETNIQSAIINGTSTCSKFTWNTLKCASLWWCPPSWPPFFPEAECLSSKLEWSLEPPWDGWSWCSSAKLLRTIMNTMKIIKWPGRRRNFLPFVSVFGAIFFVYEVNGSIFDVKGLWSNITFSLSLVLTVFQIQRWRLFVQIMICNNTILVILNIGSLSERWRRYLKMQKSLLVIIYKLWWRVRISRFSKSLLILHIL